MIRLLVAVHAWAGSGPPIASIADLTDQADGVCIATISGVVPAPLGDVDARPQEDSWWAATLADVVALSRACPEGATLRGRYSRSSSGTPSQWPAGTQRRPC